MDRSAQTQILGDQLPRRVSVEPELVSLDCNDVDDVYRIAAASFPAVWTEKEFCYFLAHENRLCLGLASHDGDRFRLRAYFLGLLVQGDLDIISVATDPEDRRLGLGERLLREVCRQPGVSRAFLEVEVSNGPAIALYTKLGFETLGRRHAYYGPDRDAYLMRWVRPGRS